MWGVASPGPIQLLVNALCISIRFRWRGDTSVSALQYVTVETRTAFHCLFLSVEFLLCIHMSLVHRFASHS